MPSTRTGPFQAKDAPSRSADGSATPGATADLDAYRQKRQAAATPEPFAATTAAATGARRLFVVQQHAATRLHWDFRLEAGDVLKSWAVPKGPSMDPQDKRFAVQVEDHPVEYADFEGSIPDGNYGAGQVIVWDQGTYVELEPFETGFAEGKLLFQLNGHKLRGRFTLIELKGRDNTGKEWLLIKERDDWVREASLPEDSVLSGLTVAEMREPDAVADAYAARIERLRAPKAVARLTKPMLAKPSPPFDRDGWVYEIKYDGYRLLVERNGADVTLHSRNGIDLTSRFPEIVRCARCVPCAQFVIDGEVVVHDDRGVPKFGRLQNRAAVRGERATAQAARHDPVTFYAFDLPQAAGYDLTAQPLLARKACLEALLPSVGLLRYSAHVKGNGIETFHAMAKLGLEGVVGKRADSPYRSGRSEYWLKVRANRSGDFVIVGWVPQKNNAADLGALALAEYRAGELAFCGRIGSGLDEAKRRQMKQAIDALPPGDPLPYHGKPPTATSSRPPTMKDIRWVRPMLVCEAEYREYSLDGHLRNPVFLRLRDDKQPTECLSAFDEPMPEAAPPAPAREVIVSNLDKVFYPEKQLTKGDLLTYYEKVAPWMLPYLADRPLVLTRFPDGIHGKSFYQRDAPAFVPDWLERKTLWSDSAEREVHYFVVQNVESLVYLANMGAIPIHAWHSRTTDLQHPDWCVLDLDPKDAPFAHVLATAKAVKELLDEIRLPGFLKTSGASGLHILMPLARRLTHRQATTLGELLARVVVHRYPDICTIARMVRQRDGKVYLDYLQNGHGQLLVAPLSARAEPAASVSMPVKWSELNGRLANANYHLKNAVARLKRMGDPMAPVLTTTPDLESALARLRELMAAG